MTKHTILSKKAAKPIICVLLTALLAVTAAGCALEKFFPDSGKPSQNDTAQAPASTPESPSDKPAAPPETPDDTPAPAAPAQTGGELSEAELTELASYFNDTQHNGLLRFAYDNLGDVKPYVEILFYDMGFGPLDPEEKQELLDTYFDGDDPDCDCSRLPRDLVINYLYGNIAEGTGDTSWLSPIADGTGPGSLGIPYLEKYDSYYLVHGDTMMSGYTFGQGERDTDGRVHLYYTTSLWQYGDDGELDILWDQPMCATLAPHPDGGEGWLMISNQIIE